jgi:hypothetical protein
VSVSTPYLLKKRAPVRKLVSVVLAAGLLASLAACTNGAAGGDCAPLYSSGGNSDLVTAKGKIGADPKAEFATPIVGKKVQVSTLTKGEGAPIQPGATAVVQVSIYDGKTGDLLISSDYTGSGVIGYVRDDVPAFGAVVQCEPIGSRVAAVGPAGEMIGDGAITQYKLPITADDNVVLVADLVGSYLGKANGADQVAQAGFPSIALAPDGRPGFTFSGDSVAPKKFEAVNLKSGSGATVKAGDAVVLNYTAVAWGGKTVAETTWDGLPTVKVASSLKDSQSGLIDGLVKAIVGQKVGSQVIAIVPPELGYASGSAPAGVTEGSTLVYVVDILGIYK